MRNDHYPAGAVRALLGTDLVTPQTKEVLNKRLAQTARTSDPVFDDETFALLQAVSDCLLPQSNREEKVPLAILLEESLATSKGKGWRYAALPSDDKAIKRGLQGINEEAQTRYGNAFRNLSSTEQEALLTSVQTDKAEAATWQQLPPGLFFTELLALLAQLYYSHPFAKEEIGEVAFADAKGWQHIGLNETEHQESKVSAIPFHNE